MGASFVQTTANDISMSVNFCGQCEDEEDRLGLTSFGCDEDYSTQETWHGSHESSCGSCACNDFINGIKFKNNTLHHECYEVEDDEQNLDPSSESESSTNTASTNLTLSLTGILAFLAGMFLCCCGGFMYYHIYYKRKMGSDVDKSSKANSHIELNSHELEYSIAKTKDDDERKHEASEAGLEHTMELKQEEDVNAMDETRKLHMEIAEKKYS